MKNLVTNIIGLVGILATVAMWVLNYFGYRATRLIGFHDKDAAWDLMLMAALLAVLCFLVFCGLLVMNHGRTRVAFWILTVWLFCIGGVLLIS